MDIIDTLRERFAGHEQRHWNVAWETVEERLQDRPEMVKVLAEMERTGGEPDVIAVDGDSGEVVFCDCAAESPAGRRSLCYDDQALAARKEAKPRGSAVGMAAAMGIELLGETEYRALQKLGSFDIRTSSWVRTPEAIRERGGALFCDRRHDAVFVYHNGASSYYAARGFRGLVRI
jgi:hypothetical protein